MGASQSDHHKDIQDFHQLISTLRCPCISITKDHHQSSFVPESLLRDYFQDSYHAKRLLAALYPDVECPVNPERILKYSRVFSILLLIGKGHFIQNFVQHQELQDHKLPFDDQPRSFPTDTADARFFIMFYKRQWEFCPPEFEEGMDVHFRDEYVLPILEEKEIGKGGSGRVYKIVLHKDYNKLQSDGSRASVIVVVVPSISSSLIRTRIRELRTNRKPLL